VSTDPTVITRTACVADGTALAGQASTDGDVGEETGFDNCAAGYHCLNGICTEICSRNGTTDTCANTAMMNCVEFANLFDDIDDAFLGLCTLACDAVAQDCPDAEDGCFLSLVTSEASCADVPTGSTTKIQDSPCFGPMAGSCFLNGCPKGYGAILPNLNTNPTTAVCTGFCNPIEVCAPGSTGPAATPCNANTDTLGDPAGIDCAEVFGDPNRPDNGGPNGPYQCRFIQAFYNDSEGVPVTTGFCVSTGVWGDCTTCDVTNADTFDTTCADQFSFGCVDFASLAAIPPGAMTIAQVLYKHETQARAFGIDLEALPGYSYGMSLK
jgi:hypothetical protein